MFYRSCIESLSKVYWGPIGILPKVYRPSIQIQSKFDWNPINFLSKIYRKPIEGLLKFYRDSTEFYGNYAWHVYIVSCHWVFCGYSVYLLRRFCGVWVDVWCMLGHLFVDMLIIDFQWMPWGPCMDILWVSLDALRMLHRCSMDCRCTFNGVRCILKGWWTTLQQTFNAYSLDDPWVINDFQWMFNGFASDLWWIIYGILCTFGAFSIGFQSVSDVTPSGVRWTFGRCSTNARCIPDSCPMDFRRMVKWPPWMFG